MEEILQRSYFVTGNTGTGKTYWAKERLEEAKKAYARIRTFQDLPDSEAILFIYYPDLLVVTKGRNGEEYMKRMKYAKFLVIDDLGANQYQGFDPIVYSVINYRIEKEKATIVTTNMTLEEIGNVDDRLASRLSTYYMVHAKGKDKRSEQKKEVISI